MELARYDFEMPATLSEEEIAVILSKVDELTSWAEDVKEYALKQAVSGTRYTGFKVVEGRSNRKYTEETKVADVVANAGFDPYEKKVAGITAMAVPGECSEIHTTLEMNITPPLLKRNYSIRLKKYALQEQESLAGFGNWRKSPM